MPHVRIRSSFAVGRTEQFQSRFGSGQDLLLQIAPGTPVGGMLRMLTELGPAHAYDDMMIHVFVNGKAVGFDHLLRDGDVIDLHIPVSGG